jgi:hypothetical protein
MKGGVKVRGLTAVRYKNMIDYYAGEKLIKRIIHRSNRCTITILNRR